MSIIVPKGRLLGIIVVGSVIGYPLIAALAVILGVENKIASIIFRTILLSLALFALVLGGFRSNRFAGVVFVFFWLAYLSRLFVTLVLEGETTSSSADYYWIWALGVCLIPSLALLCNPLKYDYGRLGSQLLAVGVISAALILYLGDTLFQNSLGQIYDQNRWSLASLNSIAVGHMGASLLLTASGVLLAGSRNHRVSILATVAAVFGIILIFYANSRGPMVAVGLALVTLSLAQIRQMRTWLYGAIFVAIGAVVVIRQSDLIFGTTGIIDRFNRMITGQDLSAEGRLRLYEAASNQFLASPLTGDGIEVREFSFYPHNVILEAFMATGVFGGFAFCTLLFLAFRRAWHIFRNDPGASWLGLLAIQYIVGAQLSGAIYQAGAMWVLIACLISMPQTKKPLFSRRSQIAPSPSQQPQGLGYPKLSSSEGGPWITQR